MSPVIVKAHGWILREFMRMVLLDPHTSTLMPDMQLSAARLVRSSLSVVSLGAGCRWVGRTCHMERPRDAAPNRLRGPSVPTAVLFGFGPGLCESLYGAGNMGASNPRATHTRKPGKKSR